jgi:hypothetical protein
MAALELPDMTPRQEASWRGIIAVAERVPTGEIEPHKRPKEDVAPSAHSSGCRAHCI